jgi:hypothetical protein
MTAQVIDRGRLGELTKIGQGVQGVVCRAPYVKTKFAVSMVYKEYKTDGLAEIDFTALAATRALVEDTATARVEDALSHVTAASLTLPPGAESAGADRYDDLNRGAAGTAEVEAIKDPVARWVPVLYQPIPNPPISAVFPLVVEIADGGVLLVGTDGVGDPLGTGGGGFWNPLRGALAQAAPPSLIEFAHAVDYSGETFDDDRTLVTVRPRKPVPARAGLRRRRNPGLPGGRGGLQ